MIKLLTVASWYPAVDETARGRFVADQVEALLRTREVIPLVASFELIVVRPPSQDPDTLAAIVDECATAAVQGSPNVLSQFGYGCPLGIPVARLPVPTAPHEPGRLADHYGALLNALANKVAGATSGRGIVHAHTGFPDGYGAVGLASRLGWPLVVTEHSSRLREIFDDPGSKSRYLATIDAASRIIAVSETQAALLRALEPLTASKLTVIPNAVPVEQFSVGSPDGRKRGELLFVGSRKEAKGIPLLIEALRRVRERRTDVVLRLVGRSPTFELEEQWHEIARASGLADAVVFDGPEDRAGVAAAMARADLFVHASRRETFGVVAAEALASGLPVVATDSGGVTEILGQDPRAFGALVPSDDPQAFADAVVEALDRRESFDPEALRASVASRFGADIVAARLVDLYRDVAGETSAAAPERAGAGWPGSLAGVAFPSQTLVAGLNRVRAQRLLAPLPDELLHTITLVTSAARPEVELPAALGTVILEDLAAPYREALLAARARHARPRRLRDRVLRRVRRVVMVSRRSGRSRQREHEEPLTVDEVKSRAGDFQLAAARNALARAVEAFAAESDAHPAPFICLDADDYRAAEPLIRAGAVCLEPGSVRWLADQWVSARGGAVTRGTSTRAPGPAAIVSTYSSPPMPKAAP